MDLPKPPEDQELRNIIDKLAQFVARNGPEFEQMTKNKQKDNQKFAFLFGGEYFNYYQYKVTTEQAILKQKQKTLEQHQHHQQQQVLVQHAITQQSIQSAPWQPHLQQQQQQQLQDSIQQSERNLAAQHHVLMQQQQLQIDEAIRKAQDDKLQLLAMDSEIDLVEADKIVQPIIDSCTKDSISVGKSWIFNHAMSNVADELISRYLVKRITALGTPFELKLHLVYLINDVLHHCVRKSADELKRALGTVVIPIFCTTSIGASDEQQQKLAKLLKLWESNKYFEPNILEQLKNPASSLAAYQAGLLTEYAPAIAPITASIQTQYAALQKQHQDFVAHIRVQLQTIQYALQNVANQSLQAHPTQLTPPPSSQQQTPAAPSQQPQAQQQQAPLPSSIPPQPQQLPPPKRSLSPIQTQPQLPPPPTFPIAGPPQMGAKGAAAIPENGGSLNPLSATGGTTMNSPPHEASVNAAAPNLNSGPPVNFGQPPPNFLPNFAQPPPNMPNFNQPPPGFPPTFNQPPPPNFNQPPPAGIPPHFTPAGLPLPDLSKPPPGFAPLIPPPNHVPPSEQSEQAVVPNVPYFELPAGLMTSLVKLEDCEYKALDPNEIVLPPPQAPSERLLSAVEMFYAPPSHERPRNSIDGWEQLGLYEFFKAKSQAKKKKEEEIREGRRARSPRSKSRSRSRERQFRSWSRSPPRRRYREDNRSGSGTFYNRPRSKSRSKSRSRSRSRSKSRSPVQFVQRTRSKSRSRSRSSSPQPPPSRSRRRSSSRSPTPPSFFRGNYATTNLDRRLDESNKGHQLLKKMGWSGAGLGATEQGIQDPISGGDVRDRQDQYKGVGINLNDPFESFRKSKGQAFINRMKARAEEKLNQ